MKRRQVPAQKPENGRITLGRIGAPHGIHGWVKLHSFTQPMLNIREYRGEFHCAGPRGCPASVEVDEIRPHGRTLIAHVRGYDTPERSRELTGLELQVDAERLPELAKDEYYWAQLQGLQVINRQGECLGQVSHLLETGANDVLVVAPAEDSIDDQERLIPWLPGTMVDRVDQDAGRIEVDWERDW